MGVRLKPQKSEKLNLKNFSMLSTAVAPGTIQIPPDGCPIVLLADAQTTGGYPRIGQLAAVDISAMAQIRTGQEVYFQQITLEEAEQLWFEQERKMRLLQYALSAKYAASNTVSISFKGMKA
jgi:antagonist of KipI